VTTVRHVARAVGSTGLTTPAYGVDVRYDTDDDGRSAIVRTITVPLGLTPEQRERLADVAERTPVTLAIRAGTPITTTFLPRNP
jgi:putative redox protein